jgi:hypothetical protein
MPFSRSPSPLHLLLVSYCASYLHYFSVNLLNLKMIWDMKMKRDSYLNLENLNFG